VAAWPGSVERVAAIVHRLPSPCVVGDVDIDHLEAEIPNPRQEAVQGCIEPVRTVSVRTSRSSNTCDMAGPIGPFSLTVTYFTAGVLAVSVGPERRWSS
jgi:hypothetical protein